MSDAFVNQVTLNCLMNKEQYSKYVSNVITKKINRKDKKFYRKRIYNLTKELLLTDEQTACLLPDVKYAFDNYIKTCIYYFKTLDNNDIIQEEYKEINNAELNKLFDKDVDLDNIVTPEEANKFLMRSIKLNNPSLDNFVIKTITKMPEDIILPKQKEINLMDPILKNKGICKKKNITNKYHEKKNTQNENIENIEKKI